MDSATVGTGRRRAFVYGRVSTSEQARDDATSLDQQVERAKAYATSQGWTVAGEFVDAAISGALPLADRPGGAALLAAIEAGEGNAVVVLKVDRFTRSLADSSTLDKWKRDGVAFASVAESFDTSQPTGVLMLDLLQVFAKFERARIAERNEEGRRAIVDDERYQTDGGKVWRWTGGKLPYGYTTDETKRIIEHEIEGDGVRRMFALRGLGWSTTRIAETLTDEGYRTHRKRKGTATERPVSSDLVTKVLDPSAGHYLGDGIERRLSKSEAPVVFAAPALVDPETFAAATSATKQVAQVPNVGHRLHEYALSQRISHVHSDGSVSGMFGLSRTRRDTGDRVRFYRCSDARTERGCEGFGEVNKQNMTSVSADLIEALVLRTLYRTSPVRWHELLAAKRATVEVEIADVDVDELRAQVVALERKASRLEVTLANVLGAEADSVEALVKPQTVANELRKVRARQDGVQARIEAIEADLAELSDVETAIQGMHERVEDVVLELGTRREYAGEAPVGYAVGNAAPEGSDIALVSAATRTIDTAPDRYGRSPVLPLWAIEAAREWIEALDLRVQLTAGDVPRRPQVEFTVSGERLETAAWWPAGAETLTPRDSARVSAC